MSDFKEKLESIRAELNRVKSVGEDICIVGVTKFQPVDLIKKAVQSGLLDLAVNYAQEGEILRKQLSSPQIRWHFIGHVQSRKVKYISEYEVIQSLDRIEIAEALSQRLSGAQKKSKVLVEVNIGSEVSKSGIDQNHLGKFLEKLKLFNSLDLKGLMCMPPPFENVEERRPFFQKAKRLYNEFAPTYSFDTLSMGTSDDYRIAVEEGSNMVRLGTTLFGKRISK